MTRTGAIVSLTLALFAAQGPRAAAKGKGGGGAKKRGPAPTSPAIERHVQAPVRPAPTPSPKRTEGSPSAASGTGSSEGGAAEAGEPAPNATKPAKTKVYTFGAMDVEGKLKTPQLLYFLNRVKLELEMSAPDHRSFMKELERTADDPSL
jgi:hypothetical protein